MPRTTSRRSGLCSDSIFSAVCAAYFSQSGRGTLSMSSARWVVPTSSECVGEMVWNVGSCTCSASSESSARRRLPAEMRASSVGTCGGRVSFSFLAA